MLKWITMDTLLDGKRWFDTTWLAFGEKGEVTYILDSSDRLVETLWRAGLADSQQAMRVLVRVDSELTKVYGPSPSARFGLPGISQMRSERGGEIIYQLFVSGNTVHFWSDWYIPLKDDH